MNIKGLLTLNSDTDIESGFLSNVPKLFYYFSRSNTELFLSKKINSQLTPASVPLSVTRIEAFWMASCGWDPVATPYKSASLENMVSIPICKRKKRIVSTIHLNLVLN